MLLLPLDSRSQASGQHYTDNLKYEQASTSSKNDVKVTIDKIPSLSNTSSVVYPHQVALLSNKHLNWHSLNHTKLSHYPSWVESAVPTLEIDNLAFLLYKSKCFKSRLWVQSCTYTHNKATRWRDTAVLKCRARTVEVDIAFPITWSIYTTAFQYL